MLSTQPPTRWVQRASTAITVSGYERFFLSGYPNGDLNTVVFTLTEEEFAAVSCGEPVIVQYGIAPSDEVWQFGNLDKTILKQLRSRPRTGARRRVSR